MGLKRRNQGTTLRLEQVLEGKFEEKNLQREIKDMTNQKYFLEG